MPSKINHGITTFMLPLLFYVCCKCGRYADGVHNDCGLWTHGHSRGLPIGVGMIGGKLFGVGMLAAV